MTASEGVDLSSYVFLIIGLDGKAGPNFIMKKNIPIYNFQVDQQPPMCHHAKHEECGARDSTYCPVPAVNF